MANESVTLNEWGPLLRKMPLYVDGDGNLACSLSADELERTERSAAEIIRVVIDGFSAIGELQWRAAAYDQGSIDADVFAMLAPLQTQLAELVAALRITESNAAHYQRELEAAHALTQQAQHGGAA